ncbi:MAG: hypothetical protein K2G54_01850 [Malacoplasma sp.]|nr:hypothetical protein [Malacoplasma sp.]
MTIDQITNQINKILSKNNLSFKITSKNMSSSLKDAGIDSLEMMELIVQVEEQLNIQLPDDKLLELKTASDLINLIKDTVNKK